MKILALKIVNLISSSYVLCWAANIVITGESNHVAYKVVVAVEVIMVATAIYELVTYKPE